MPARILAVTMMLIGCAPQQIIRDNYLAGHDSDFSGYYIADIFMALPNKFFETTISNRADLLRQSDVTTAEMEGVLVAPGDGAQPTITLRVLSWSKPDFVVSVRSQHIDHDTTTYLRRVDAGWIEIREEDTLKFKKANNPQHPTA